MKILSIETSCDETAVSLLEITGPLEKPDIKVLANSLLSQIHLHQEYGGVYPNLAKREHQKNLPPLTEKTLKDAGENLDSPDIQCIAVTQGPGLEPALWVGITFAEELGEKWGKPVIPINHMEGHIWSVLHESAEALLLPAIALLVSGGHTELVYIKDFNSYEVIGRTKDDAVGEAFDKVARMIGLPYPGGPEISKLAHKHRESGADLTIKFPRPMINSGNLDFSFSGLKTAVLYAIKPMDTKSEKVKEEISRAFEDAAVDVLVSKTKQALERYPGEVKTLILGGGVAANVYLKEKLSLLISETPDISLRIPVQSLTTDNAIMIGIAAYISTKGGQELQGSTESITAKGNLLLGA